MARRCCSPFLRCRPVDRLDLRIGLVPPPQVSDIRAVSRFTPRSSATVELQTRHQEEQATGNEPLRHSLDFSFLKRRAPTRAAPPLQPATTPERRRLPAAPY